MSYRVAAVEEINTQV